MKHASDGLSLRTIMPTCVRLYMTYHFLLRDRRFSSVRGLDILRRISLHIVLGLYIGLIVM